jgi:hypothetical protein
LERAKKLKEWTEQEDEKLKQDLHAVLIEMGVLKPERRTDVTE